MARTAESYVPEFEARLKRLLENEDSEQGRQISRRHGVVVHSKKVISSPSALHNYSSAEPRFVGGRERRGDDSR